MVLGKNAPPSVVSRPKEGKNTEAMGFGSRTCSKFMVLGFGRVYTRVLCNSFQIGYLYNWFDKKGCQVWMDWGLWNANQE